MNWTFDDLTLIDICRLIGIVLYPEDGVQDNRRIELESHDKEALLEIYQKRVRMVASLERLYWISSDSHM